MSHRFLPSLALTLCLLLPLLSPAALAGGPPPAPHARLAKPALAAPNLEQLKSRKEAAPAAGNAPATQPAAAARGPAKAAVHKLVGWITLSGPIRESGSAPFPFQVDPSATVRGIIAQLRTVADDPRYSGVVINLEEVQLRMSQVFELDRAMSGVRAAGKKVLIFSDSYDMPAYLLACGGDEILLQEGGRIELTGMHSEEMYLLGLLEKLGIKADFLQVGQFKGAQEPMTRTGPSEQWSQNMDRLLDDIYAQTMQRISQARGLDKAQIEKILGEIWGYTDQDCKKSRLVDQVVNRDMEEATGKAFGDDFDWDDAINRPTGPMRMDNPLALFQVLFQAQRIQLQRPSLALIHLSGAIVDGDSSGGGPFASPSAGSRTLMDALSHARDEELIRGVVLRIDSPGGSASASENIWQAVAQLAQEKPVFISIGSMAASGGYYVACAGSQIYADPSSIVGSIGVVGGKMAFADLYEKIGISVFRRNRGPLADMFNSTDPFTPEQRQALESAFKRTYEQFTQRVRTGRGDRLKDLDQVAQGRIFTGRESLANGLIDKVGSEADAIADLATSLGLPPGQFDLVHLPPPPTLPEMLGQLLGSVVGAQAPLSHSAALPILSQARAILGPAQWEQAQPVLQGLLLIRHEPVLTLLPVVIDVR